MAETVRHPMLMLDTNLAVVSANRAFYDTFAVTPAEAEGRRVYEVGDGRWNSPALHRLLEEMLPRDGVVEGFQVTQCLKDGDRRTLLLNARRLDAARLIVLAIEDVTERRRAEEIGAEWHGRYAAAVRAGGLVLYDGDKRAGTIAWSGEAEHVLGYPLGEMGGYAWWLERVHPEDRERIADGVRLALARRQAVDLEYRLRCRGGSYRVVADRGELHRDEAGKVVRVVGFLRDITARKRAEEALRRSEGTLRVALKAARLGAWERDLRTGELTASATCKANLGLPPDAPLTFEMLQAMRHPDDRDRVAEAVRRAVAECTDYDVETRVIWPDGSIHWLMLRGHAFYDDAGKPVRMIGVTLDITERKRTEEALKESETRFRALADSAPVLIWMSGPDKAGVYFNKPWLDFTGRTVEQELGEGWIESVHPEDRQALAACAEAFAARRPFRTDFRLRRRDGEWRWMLDTGVPRFAPDGTFAGYIGSCIDITERRAAEAALRESEERLKLAQEAAGIGTWDWNLVTGEIRWSPEMFRLLGLDPERDAADPYGAWLRALHPEDRDQADAEARRHAREGVPFASEWRVVHPDGSVRWILGRGRSIGAADGTPARMIGVNLDITEHKRAEEERELLLAELSHRVKNTLATVQSIAAQTLADGAEPDTARPALEGRLRALAHTHSLLAEGDWRGVGLRAVVRAELAPFDGRADITGEDLELRPRAALTLGMAVHELVTNAAKYGALSAPKERVEVFWTRVGDGTDGTVLRLRWREVGGPPVRPPERRGFGRTLIERGIAYDLAGAARMEFRREGLRCELEIPLAEAVAS